MNESRLLKAHAAITCIWRHFVYNNNIVTEYPNNVPQTYKHSNWSDNTLCNFMTISHVSLVSWAAKRLQNYCIEAVCLWCVCPSAMALKWRNIAHSQYNAMQLYTLCWYRGEVSEATYKIVNYHINTQTAFVTTLSVSPKSLKCNISIANCPIALQFYTGVKHLKVHTCIYKIVND